MGQTRRHKGRDLLRIAERNGKAVDDVDGCLTDDRRAMGTYVHGLFDTPDLITPVAWGKVGT